MTTPTNLTAFYTYVLSFYGFEGLYPMDVSYGDIKRATDIYLSRSNTSFCGDSFDREAVRDILLSAFGYTWPDVAYATA